MTTLTLDEVLRNYGRKVAGWPSTKYRDPEERELLLRAGDNQVQREDPERIKRAGERPKP